MLNNVLGVLGEPTPPVTSSYESIQSFTVGSGGSASITFGSGGTIPQGYKHLQIRAWVKGTTAGDQDTNIRLGNGSVDSGSNYSHHALYGTGSGTPAAAGSSSQTKAIIGYNFAVGTGAASTGSAVIIDILDYNNTSKYKTIRNLGGNDKNGSGFLGLYSGLWQSTSAVNIINIYPDSGSFAEYSSFALYGIKG